MGMRTYHRMFFFLISALISTQHAAAQSLELGISAGGSLYNGDLSRADMMENLRDMGLATGAFARLRLSESLSFRAAGQVMRLAGNEYGSGGNFDQGKYFFSQVQELSLLGEWRIFRLGRGAFQVAPFIAFGVAGFHFDPQVTIDGQAVRLQPLGTEGQGLPDYNPPYSLYDWSIPVGGGLQISLNDRWSLGLELIGRRSQTDYLDDVSDQVVRYWDILIYKGTLAAFLSNPGVTPDTAPNDLTYQRGRGYTDWYFAGGLTVGFRIAGQAPYRKGAGLPCPRF